MPTEDTITLDCGEDWMCGILHRPTAPAPHGLVIVVGGPQYRVGSHRQFVLLARFLAAQNIPVLRFDYRGMGDSTGETRSFESVEDDIRVAIDAFFREIPGLHNVVLWGLCDAASAALLYAYRDRRVGGLILLNPWVSTEQGSAQTLLKHYYWQRLADKRFWRKLLTGRVDPFASVSAFRQSLRKAFAGRRETEHGLQPRDPSLAGLPLPDRMRLGLRNFRGNVLLILSGRDLVAAEFGDVARASPDWQDLLAGERVIRQQFSEADHTFSRREWRDQVARWTLEWMRNLPVPP